MVDGEQHIVSMTHVVHAKVDAGLVGRRPYHQVQHGFLYIYVIPPLRTLVSPRVPISVTLALAILYRLLMFSISIATHFYVHIFLIAVAVVSHVSFLYLVKVLGYSVLPPVLRLCLS